MELIWPQDYNLIRARVNAGTALLNLHQRLGSFAPVQYGFDDHERQVRVTIPDIGILGLYRGHIDTELCLPRTITGMGKDEEEAAASWLELVFDPYKALARGPGNEEPSQTLLVVGEIHLPVGQYFLIASKDNVMPLRPRNVQTLPPIPHPV